MFDDPNRLEIIQHLDELSEGCSPDPPAGPPTPEELIEFHRTVAQHYKRLFGELWRLAERSVDDAASIGSRGHARTELMIWLHNHWGEQPKN
jgi:hypothetical protein